MITREHDELVASIEKMTKDETRVQAALENVAPDVAHLKHEAFHDGNADHRWIQFTIENCPRLDAKTEADAGNGEDCAF